MIAQQMVDVREIVQEDQISKLDIRECEYPRRCSEVTCGNSVVEKNAAEVFGSIVYKECRSEWLEPAQLNPLLPVTFDGPVPGGLCYSSGEIPSIGTPGASLTPEIPTFTSEMAVL